MAEVERIDAVATLGDVDAALTQARRSASGDADWWELIDQEREGRAVVVSLDVSLRGVAAGGEPFELTRNSEAVWASVPAHLPDLEEELRGVAAGLVSDLADQLRERGVEVRDDALGRMFIHVSLTDGLRDYVRAAEMRG